MSSLELRARMRRSLPWLVATTFAGWGIGACSADSGGSTAATGGTQAAVGGGTGAQCLAPLVACPEGCVDIGVSVTNCGQCGRACGLGDICVSTQCHPQAGTPVLGSGGSFAAGGAAQVGGMGTTGGAMSSGGAVSGGGTPPSGGISGTGGAVGGGGTSTGGSVSTGGTVSTGGVAGTSGSAAAGGASTGGAATGGNAGTGGISAGGSGGAGEIGGEAGIGNVSTGTLHGYFPSTVTEEYASGLYEAWKQAWVASCGDGSLRVKWDDESRTVSEGIGYGMLLAAAWNDRETFDGLSLYFQKHINTNGMMGWIGTCDNTEDSGSAADADLDAAMALLMADCAWPGQGYGDDATQLIGALRDNLLMDDGGHVFLCAGDGWSGDCCGNASYQTPAYYRAFGEHVGDAAFWNAAADDSYYYLNANNNQSTGLVSDWMDPDSLRCDAKGWGDYHGWDASRVPWRVATDYIWWGDTQAQEYSNVVASFVQSNGGIPSTCQGYTLDGSQCDGTPVATFAGAFASSGIPVSQEMSDQFFQDLKSIDSAGYFNAILNVLYFTLAVERFRPGC